MKAKKVLKRMNRVEELLSNVIDQCPARRRGLLELLDSAMVSVARAKEVVHARVSRASKKPLARALKSTTGRLSAEGRSRISLAAKKRWAVAKRKGINAVTGRPLSKTA